MDRKAVLNVQKVSSILNKLCPVFKYNKYLFFHINKTKRKSSWLKLFETWLNS